MQERMDKTIDNILKEIAERDSEKRSEGESLIRDEKQSGTGVLQRAMTPSTTENYRAILLTGVSDMKVARLATAAIEESQRFGVPITCIVDRLHAEASCGVGNRLTQIFNALTHTTLNTNQPSILKRWFGKKDNDTRPSGDD